MPSDAQSLQNPATTLERGERSAGLTEFEAPIVAAFADLVVLLGLPKSVGEIYGLLFATAGSLTFVEIEQKLELSKGSVSQGLRALRDLGAIAEAEPDADGTAAPQARLARWVATIELRKLIGSLLRERLTPYLARQDQRVAAAEAALAGLRSGLPPEHQHTLENRLEKIQTWQNRARTVLPVIGKLL